jgi:hypothetical protein
MDNIYQEGSFVTAKVNPELKLKIERYFKRIYYCSIVSEPGKKNLPYFERELIGPSEAK